MPRFILPVVTEKPKTGRTGTIFSLYFYEAYSGNSAYTYSDNALTQPIANPVESDEYGVFPDIFLANLDGGYRVEMRDDTGKTYWSKSEVYGGAQTPSNIGAHRGVVWLFYGTVAGAGNDLDVMLADGWSIADGTTGFLGDTTPDLTGSFLRMVTDVFDLTDVIAGNSSVTLLGSVDSHVLTVDEIPAHTHATGNSNTVYKLAEEFPPTGQPINTLPVNSGTNANRRYGEHVDAGNDEGHTHTLTFSSHDPSPSYVVAIPLIYGY